MTLRLETLESFERVWREKVGVPGAFPTLSLELELLATPLHADEGAANALVDWVAMATCLRDASKQLSCSRAKLAIPFPGLPLSQSTLYIYIFFTQPGLRHKIANRFRE